MKKYVVILLILFYPSASIPQSLTVYNKCYKCDGSNHVNLRDDSWRINFAYLSYGESITFNLPAPGEYSIGANCFDGHNLLQWEWIYCFSPDEHVDLELTCSTSTTTTERYICLAEKIFGEYSEQTELLRYFRDNVLNQTSEGQEIIRLYYELSPTIVKAMEEDKQFSEEVKKMIDGVLEVISTEID